MAYIYTTQLSIFAKFLNSREEAEKKTVLCELLATLVSDDKGFLGFLTAAIAGDISGREPSWFSYGCSIDDLLEEEDIRVHLLVAMCLVFCKVDYYHSNYDCLMGASKMIALYTELK